MTRLCVLLGGCALALTLATPAASARTYEHARALGTRCSTCHTSTSPHLANLNGAGRYFLKHRTLEGYTPAPADKKPAPRAVTGKPGAKAAASGLEIYGRSCAVCHGEKGGGTALAKPLTGPPQHARTEEEIARVVRDGIKGTTMAPFRGALTPDEIAAVVRYVASLRK